MGLGLEGYWSNEDESHCLRGFLGLYLFVLFPFFPLRCTTVQEKDTKIEVLDVLDHGVFCSDVGNYDADEVETEMVKLVEHPGLETQVAV